MTPTNHQLCNDVLRKPPGMTEEECRDLHIRREDGCVWSFWKPDAEELIALNRGGTVALAVMGATHPPLSIHATHPHEPQDAREVDASEYRHRLEAVNGRLNALDALTKKVISAWTGNRENERQSLTDRFLDMLNANKCDGSFVETVPADDKPAVTQADVDRYRSDAEGWKAAEEMTAATAVYAEAFNPSAYEAAKGDLARVDATLSQIADALGDDWNVMPFPEAITAIKNRLAMAEAGRDLERERRQIAEGRIRSAAEILNPNQPES